jgi:hypothetical protein
MSDILIVEDYVGDEDTPDSRRVEEFEASHTTEDDRNLIAKTFIEMLN